MVEIQAIANDGQLLSNDVVAETIHKGLAGKFQDQKVLVLIPDHTRSIPLPALFEMLVEALSDTKNLDFMVALGTHPPLTDSQMNHLVGITSEERTGKYQHIGLFNHQWDTPVALQQIGTLSQEEVQDIIGDSWHPSLGGDIPIKLNARVMDYDHILVLGPTFPHEVVGFSGGAKYFFPGISGPEMINVTHWLGALGGVQHTIGVKETPIRKMLHAAVKFIPVSTTLISLVVEGQGLAGMFIGDIFSAWEAAADLSSQVHIKWCDTPYRRVLSKAPQMYDELWTAAKAMYKLEAVVADGGELIVWAPHLDTVSFVHGKYIFEAGYHVAEYFLKQWEAYHHIPLGVLAHCTHLKGAGSYHDGVESPRIKVTLASGISEADCQKLNLGYLDPNSINETEWIDREADGLLYVPKAGEMLYRLRG